MTPADLRPCPCGAMLVGEPNAYCVFESDHGGDCAWRFRTASPEAPVTAPPVSPDTLDFEKAMDAWLAREGLGVDEAFRADLQRQHTAALDKKNQEIERLRAERELLQNALLAANDDRDASVERLATVEAQHDTLRGVVREWQDAKKPHEWNWETTAKFQAAEAALASFPVEAR